MIPFKILNFFTDQGLVLFFLSSVKPFGTVKRSEKLLALSLLMLSLPFYVNAGTYTGDFLDTLVRFIVRAAGFVFYIRLTKKRSWMCSLYLGGLTWISCTAVNNIFLTHLFYPLRTGIFWVNWLSEMCLTALILALFSQLIALDEIVSVGKDRLYFMSVLIAVQLYIKATLAQISVFQYLYGQTVLSSYPLIMQLLIICACICFERYLYNRSQKETARLLDVANRYRYEYSQANAAATENLRQVHHDLKNHLYAIQRLVNEDNHSVNSYIQSLVQDLNDYEVLVHTGNDLLDGLLSQKIRRAHEGNIDIIVNVDFSAGGFMRECDLCALFGNALDNALEASALVSQPELRSILVKCSTILNSLVIVVRNYYEGDLIKSGLQLISRKTEHGHGVGLSSIQRTVKMYDGTVTYHTDEMHNFVLSIRIPLPEQNTH